jgi:single-stranded-DNA-specific exonuclease
MVKLEKSIREREWILPTAPPKGWQEQFPEYSTLSATLLYARGLATDDAIQQFLNPEYPRTLHAPRLLRGMDQATGIICEAINEDIPILVYGDYDVDGVSATALLVDALGSLGAQVRAYIPHRHTDGYGLRVAPVTQLITSGSALIITVDCGVTAVEEVAELQRAGHRVIITDHHLPGSVLPEADALINPNIPDDSYPNKALSGVGVAFRLASALFAELVEDQSERERREKWLLDLVALGTVADVSYQSPENRTLITYGLIVLGKTKRPGLRALLKESGVDGTPSSQDIGFRLAPRLNAVGRLAAAQTAFDLLVATTPEEGSSLCRELAEHNQRRQHLVDIAVNEARGITQDRLPLAIAAGPWERGIVGLVAGRLAEEQQRPAIVASTLDSIYHGSARSVGDVDVVELLRSEDARFITLGGHTSAAGFSAREADWQLIAKSLQHAAAQHRALRDYRPSYSVDAVINGSDVSVATATEVARFAPFGPGNPEPLLVIQDLELSTVQPVGATMRHAKLQMMTSQGNVVSGIAFGFGGHIDTLRRWRQIDVLGKVRANTFRGQTRAELEVVDVRSSH